MKTVQELIEFAESIPELGATPMAKGPDAPDHLSIYTRKEMALLATYARNIPHGGTAVEIGVYVGHTASVLLNLQEELELDIVLVDNWSWMMPDARHSFNLMMEMYFVDTPYQGLWMTSSEAYRQIVTEANVVEGHSLLDYIHIDGCHDRGENGVDEDCRLWLPMLNRGGVAVFHDHDCEPVRRTVEEYCPGWSGEEAGRTAVRVKP